MKNVDVAELLYEIADYLEIQDVEYKPRAYRTAARNIESLSEDVEDVHKRGELQEIDGVGESIAEKVAEYLETGELEYYEELRADLPVDMEALTSVEGIGPKTAKKLYRTLGVKDLTDLERAADKGRIAEVEGFGERSQQNILDHLELAKRGQERMLLGRAFPIARSVEERLAAEPAFDEVAIVGSFRRRRPTVGDIDILATASDPSAAMAAFTAHDDVEEVLSQGETKASVVVAGGLRMDLRIVDRSEWGAAIVYFTGSKDHNIALRNRAVERDWKLNEYGLFDVSGVDDARGEQRAGERLAAETEADVYEALDLPYIAPELRENTGELDAADAGTLPDLVELDDVRGDLQLHTDRSDGSAGVREMAEAADELDLEYVLVTDHGPGAPIPSKLDSDGLAAQREEIAAVNDDDAVEVTVQSGVEAEITADGIGVDADDCEACDLVVAGLHSDLENPTDLVVEAIETGSVDVLAHPTNRLIHEREPLDIDLDAVVEAAAAEQVALEINAQPQRLDLDWQSVKAYRDDVSFVVSTDAHTPGELDQLQLGVAQARRGWLEDSDVLTTRPLEELLSALGR